MTERAPAGSDLKYRCVLLKISGDALRGDLPFGISRDAIEAVAAECVEVARLGVRLALVVGGGNFVRGADAAGGTLKRATADYMGMLATMINALALRDAIELAGVQARVQSAITMQQLAEPYIRLRAIRHLEKRRVVIFGAGTGNPFFTTDTAAALRAVEVGAGMMLKATRVDGVYTDDPLTNPDAELIDEIGYMDALSRGLAVMDSTALTMCKDHGMGIVVFNLMVPGNIVRAVRGERIGTLVH